MIPRTEKVYVAPNRGDGGALVVLDGATLALLNEVSGLGVLFDTDVDPLRNRIAVVDGGVLRILDGTTLQVIDQSYVGFSVGHVAIDPIARVIVTTPRYQSPGFEAGHGGEVDGYRLALFDDWGAYGFAINHATRHVHANRFSRDHTQAVVQDYEGRHVTYPFHQSLGPIVVDSLRDMSTSMSASC